MNSNIRQLLYILFLLCITASCSLNYPSNTSRTTYPSTDNTHTNESGTADPYIAGPDNIENFYVVLGKRYAVLKSSEGFNESGIASWYGDPFHGQKTSNGEIYDMHQMTAAHKHLPLPSYVEVTNTRNGKKVVLRVNDRGPFVGDRVIDLSYAAAQALDVIDSGTAPVQIRALDDLNRVEDTKRIASPERPAFIQIGSFTERSNAYDYHKRMIRKGVRNSLIHQVKNENGLRVYRVQVGPLKNGTEYDQSIQQLNKIGIRNTILIRE